MYAVMFLWLILYDFVEANVPLVNYWAEQTMFLGLIIRYCERVLSQNNRITQKKEIGSLLGSDFFLYFYFTKLLTISAIRATSSSLRYMCRGMVMMCWVISWATGQEPWA